MDAGFSSYLGYAKFEPVEGYDALSWLVFPLNTAELKTYTIGTSSDSSMLLPKPDDDDDAVYEAVVSFNLQGRVSIKNCTKATVKVGESILQKEETCELANKTIVEFGPYVYMFQLTDAPTARYLKTIRDGVECGVCKNVDGTPKYLSCGHVFCLACLIVTESSFIQSETTFVTCPKCRTPSPFSEAQLSRNVKALEELSKNVRHFDAERPVCGTCFNQRIFVHGSDYFYCETCRLILCPVCTFDWHRDHTLSNNYILARKAGKRFAENCGKAKKQWLTISNKLKIARRQIEKAKIAKAKCVDALNFDERDIDEQTIPLSRMLTEIEHLNCLEWDNKASIERNDLLDTFETMLKATLEKLALSIDDLNSKADSLLTDKRNDTVSLPAPPSEDASLLSQLTTNSSDDGGTTSTVSSNVASFSSAALSTISDDS